MNSVNGLATRQSCILAKPTQIQKTTSAQLFSFINARSCEQRPQTCDQNKVSSSETKQFVEKKQYRQGLARYKATQVVANESLFRHWLVLIDNSDKWFNAEKTELGAKLIAQKTFKQGLAKGIQKILSQSRFSSGAQINDKDREIISKVIQRHYLLKGNFDFHSIFMDMRDNRQQLLQQLTSFFAKTLTKEQAATHARKVIAHFLSVLEEHHDNGSLDKIQQQMEAQFLKTFNYEAVSEKDLQASKCKKSEFFVVDENGSYSMVTLDNFFEPLCEPIDSKIYQQDKIENPDRSNPGAYFKAHIGEQEMACKPKRRGKNKDFGENIWEQALENEKQAEKNPCTKAWLNLNEIRTRDGLFSKKDAIESGASLLLGSLAQFNAASEYSGFTTRPSIPSKSQAEYAHQNEKPTFNSKPEITQSDVVKAKPASSGLFTFSAAEAGSIALREKTPDEKQAQNEYNSWHGQDEKPEVLNRHKRGFAKDKITLEQIIKVSFEQYLGISTDPAFEHLRAILSHDLSRWASYSDPDAEHFKEIKAVVTSILNYPQHKEKMQDFLTNTLGAFQMAAMENNQDFRRAYMFYIHENEKSMREKGTLFFHANVEDLFPSSYQAHNQGISHFQQIKKNRTKAQRASLYALLLHHQSSGKPLNYKAFAMAFAHLDILTHAMSERTYAGWSLEARKLPDSLAQSTSAMASKLSAIKQYFADRNEPFTSESYLTEPVLLAQFLTTTRFITANTDSFTGVCHYLCMSVLLASAGGDLDAIKSTIDMLADFYKFSASDPIVYFRVIQLLRDANHELYFKYTPKFGLDRFLDPWNHYNSFSNLNKLVDGVYSSQYGYNLVLCSDDKKHSIAVMPIRVGNEIIHYYYDPSLAMHPCYSKEQLADAIKGTLGLVFDVEGDNFQAGLKKMEFWGAKLTPASVELFKNLQTESGFRYNQLNKQALSQFAKSHPLSNEDWNAFFPGFNQGEKLYDKDFDSLDSDPVYKALKPDASTLISPELYIQSMKKSAPIPLDDSILSSASISDVLEREKLVAGTVGAYHDAAQALENEARRTQGIPDDGQSRTSLAVSTQNAIDRSRFGVSNHAAVGLSALGLGQSVLSAIVESDVPSTQSQANLGISGLSSRVGDVRAGFQRLGQDASTLEAELNRMNPHFAPTTIGRFLNDISQEWVSEEDLNAIDLETHKINQKVDQINVGVAQILETEGRVPDNFRFSPAENMEATGTIHLYQADNPSEKFSIDLSKHLRLASLWQDVKAAINSRSHNFASAMTSYLSAAERTNILGKGWQGVGHVSNTASKFAALYALTTLGDESQFFQQSHLENGEKTLRIFRMADLVVDNGSNVASFANMVVKRLYSPSPVLSKISRFGGKASNVVALLTQGFELSFYSYAYANAANSMEREVAKLMMVSKSFQSALSLVSMAACAAAPPMAPIFMMLGFFVSYVENAALTKTISKETANMLFQQFAGELEFMKNLLEKPEILFNEKEQQITVVSSSMPYSKLVVTADGIQMIRNAKPFAVEFTETFRQTASQYKGIVFREPGTHAANLPVYHDYESLPLEYQGYKEMLQNFGRGFEQGFSLSPETDVINEFTKRLENGRAHFINTQSTNKNGTFSEEVAQRKVVAGNIAECLTGEEEKATPTYQHTFSNSDPNKAQNIVVKGHPVRPIYQSNGCIQAEVNGYSYAPRWNEINKLDKCDIAPNGSTKAGDFWKTRKVKEVYRNTNEKAPLNLYKGKLAFKETSAMPRLNPSSIININQWNLETSWKTQTCYESPESMRVEIGSPQYVLSSGGVTPFIYHFPQDEFVENLKHLHVEDDDPETQVTGHQTYGLYSDFPITDSDVDAKGSWFDITLVPDGNTFLHLYPNTYLNISEQEATSFKGDIHFMIPYQTFRNGRRRGQQAIVSKKNNGLEELILLPKTNHPIHIKLNDSVKRKMNFDILKTLPNKSTAVCGASVSFNETGSVSLELNQLSQIPLGNIASTTAFVHEQIEELKEFVPELLIKTMRIHSLNLTKTPYHQEKSLDTSALSLAPIWEKVLNTSLTLTSSRDKTHFAATGWYLSQDDNIKNHPAVQKNAGLIILKIWRNHLPLEVQEIIQRMVFVGFARESMDAVPADVKSAIISEAECFTYHFFDPQTGLMIKQWGATEIRFWDSQDITLCSKNTIPQKVYWSGSETENYTCDAVHISPPTETMGGAAGRVAIMVEGRSSKLEFAKVSAEADKKFLDYIFDKSLSAVMQRAELDSNWNPDESEISLQNLMVHVKDIALKLRDQSTAPVQAFLLHDGESKLALVPKGEALLAIPKMQNYAITASVASTSTNKLSYKLFKRPLIANEAFDKINTQLTAGELSIDEADLPQKSEIKPEFEFVGIKNAPLNNAIICHTAEGIAMALDYDLKITTLLGVSNDYLQSKNIALNEEMAMLAEYQSLVNKVGSCAFAYLNLYQGNESNPEQASIFVNTKTAVPSLVYVPVFYQEYAQNRTINKHALSDDLIVISDTNDVQGQTKRAVVRDVLNKKIYTVWRSDKTNSSLGDVFPYTYAAPSQNGIFLGLNQHAHTPSNNVELPKINLDSVFLLPCDKEVQKRVVLGDWMLKRVNTLTLARPIQSSDYVQQILLTPSLRVAVESIKPIITQDVQGRLQLSLLMATQDQNVMQGSELIRINLENAVDAEGKLNPAFVGSIKLHNTILNLEQLTSEAYAEYSETVV